MLQIILVLLVVTYWCADKGYSVTEFNNERRLYEEFKANYGKRYTNQDSTYRFEIFRSNLERARQLQREEQGSAEYGVTEFSDLTPEEFTKLHLCLSADVPIATEEYVQTNETELNNEFFDWRQYGAVGPVLNQGSCGSCWAFSIVANIEGQWYRKTGQLLKLSEQQLVDCDSKNHGCHGGWPPSTYEQVKNMGGLELSRDYPYEGRDGFCRIRPSKLRVYVNGSIVLPPDENIQRQRLKEIGPLASILNANTLQHYRGGIIHQPSWICNPQGLSHAVLTVGYGTENGLPYWIVKNTWGTWFGEKGYFRIFRGGNTCGIGMVVSTAIIR